LRIVAAGCAARSSATSASCSASPLSIHSQHRGSASARRPSAASSSERSSDGTSSSRVTRASAASRSSAGGSLRTAGGATTTGTPATSAPSVSHRQSTKALDVLESATSSDRHGYL
jgi:hypothetical protein